MNSQEMKTRDARPVIQSLQEYARGVAGGLLFSLPLLYTMEMWWAGFIANPLRLLLYVLATFLLLLGYNRFAGLRTDANWREVAIDSVEEMGLGLLVAAAILWLLGRITSEMTGSEMISKIVIEAMTVAIGVSVGTAQLGTGGGNGDGGDEDKGMDKDKGGDGEEHVQGSGGRNSGAGGNSGLKNREKTGFGGQVVIAFCGALLFASNVGPTEEIVIIAIEATSWKLLGLALVSIALGSIIIFYTDFTGTHEYFNKRNFSDVLIGTVVTYAVALASSALILWFFGRFDGVTLVTCLSQTVVLGFAGTLGASAGRFLLQ